MKCGMRVFEKVIHVLNCLRTMTLRLVGEVLFVHRTRGEVDYFES